MSDFYLPGWEPLLPPGITHVAALPPLPARTPENMAKILHDSFPEFVRPIVPRKIRVFITNRVMHAVNAGEQPNALGRRNYATMCARHPITEPDGLSKWDIDLTKTAR